MNDALSLPTRSNSFFSAGLADADPAIGKAVAQELGRQRDGIELAALLGQRPGRS